MDGQSDAPMHADEQAPDLASLLHTYVEAHLRHGCRTEGGRPMPWVDRPIKAEYVAVRDAVRQLAPIERHSDAYVEETVEELLQEALDGVRAVDGVVTDLMAHLAHPVATLVYVPLDGVTIGDAELQIGSVHLVRMDEDALERLVVQPYAEVIRRNPRYAEPETAGFIEMHRQRHRGLVARTCVLVQTEQDLRYSFDALEDAVENTCDFLQLCLAVLTARRPENAVRWSNGVVNAWRIAFGHSDGPRPRTLSNGTMQIGGPPFHLDASSVERVRGAGLLPYGDDLDREPASEYGRTLRRAVRWFARAERERHADDRKLAYVTTVDLFFSQPPGTKDGLKVTERFCHGGAYASTEDPAEAAALARRFVYIYRSRSETSHDGAYDLADHDEIDQFRSAVLRILSGMASHPFQTKRDVSEWMSRRRAALNAEARRMMDEATARETVERDEALLTVIYLLREQSGGDVLGAGREAYVLSSILLDAFHSRAHLLQLRPFGRQLLEHARDARARRDDAVPIMLRILRKLDWLERGHRERVASRFT